MKMELETKIEKNMKITKILLLSRYDNLGASSRYRFYQYLPYLRKKGIEIKPEVEIGWLDWEISLARLKKITKNKNLFNKSFEEFKKAIKNK